MADTPQKRYDRDPEFRMLVDTMTHMVIKCRYTPTELREAALLAAIHYETTHARPIYESLGEGDFRRVDGYHGRTDR